MLKNFLLGKKFDSKRIQWIDNARGLCMFFVVVVHTGLIPEIYRYFIEPFFLTAFFLISGYLFHDPRNSFEFKFKFISIIEGVLVPYILYWTLSYVVDHVIKGDFSFYNFMMDLAMGNKLWFIAALFISQLMMCVTLKVNRDITTVMLFSFGSLLVWYLTPLSEPMRKFPWSINNALIANFFIGIGYLARIKNQAFQLLLDNKVVGFFPMFLFFILVFLNYCFLEYPYNFPANKYGNILFFLIHAVLGIHFLLFSSKMIKNNYILLFVGANSLLFYFYQNQVLKLLKKVASFGKHELSELLHTFDYGNSSSNSLSYSCRNY